MIPCFYNLALTTHMLDIIGGAYLASRRQTGRETSAHEGHGQHDRFSLRHWLYNTDHRAGCFSGEPCFMADYGYNTVAL